MVNTKDKAEALKHCLEEAEFRKHVRFTMEDLKTLDRLCSSRPPRNAVTILRALMLKAEYAYSKPRQDISIDANLSGRFILATADDDIVSPEASGLPTSGHNVEGKR